MLPAAAAGSLRQVCCGQRQGEPRGRGLRPGVLSLSVQLVVLFPPHKRGGDGRRRQEPADVQHGEHRLRRQALCGPGLGRRLRAEGRQVPPLPGPGEEEQAPLPGGGGRGRAQDLLPRGDLGHGAVQDEGDGRGLPGEEGDARRGHSPRGRGPRPGVLSLSVQ